jgi:hypothetical protein
MTTTREQDQEYTEWLRSLTDEELMRQLEAARSQGVHEADLTKLSDEALRRRIDEARHELDQRTAAPEQ